MLKDKQNCSYNGGGDAKPLKTWPYFSFIKYRVFNVKSTFGFSALHLNGMHRVKNLATKSFHQKLGGNLKQLYFWNCMRSGGRVCRPLP